MKKVIKLRNKDGQFCNLAEFCSENPQSPLPPWRTTPKGAAEYLAEDEARAIQCFRLMEVIKAFSLPHSGGSIGGLVVVYSNGEWNGQSSDLFRLNNIINNNLANNRALAAKWSATEYEVEE